MLIEFKVSNFRSIREEQTLSLVASNAVKDRPECVIERNLPGLSSVKYLKGAAIYGANASGKSNVIEAISFLEGFVRKSATTMQPGDQTGAEPFKLDKDSVSQPSKFEISFVADGVRYLFGLSLTSKRVLEEYLVAYPNGIAQHWYNRKYNNATNKDIWESKSKIFKSDISLQGKTRENALYLSIGSQFNHPQLTPIFNWFKNNLWFLNLSTGRGLNPTLTGKMIKSPRFHEQIISLLRKADIGITDAEVQEEKINVLEDLKQKMPTGIPDTVKESFFSLIADLNQQRESNESQITTFEIKLAHKAREFDSVKLNFENEESTGTKRLFYLIGSWIDALDNGHIYFIDEIESSLHPTLVKELLNLLFSSQYNTNGAQFIFTTHNVLLLDSELMRRDQIWFTEKTPEGATRLYPLTDYSPRKDEALAKGYLAGRYGAIPYLTDGLDL